MDWFFLHYFKKEPDWWRGLSDDKLMSLVTLENQKEKEYWDNWQKIIKQMLGGK